MINNRVLTFAEGEKLSLPNAFTTLIKPIGSRCNMRCTYCYYLDKSLQYDSDYTPRTIMSDEVLREYIKQYIEANDVPVVSFCWHGGEPLLAGVKFYEKALYYQQKYANGKKIENALQTNSLLINDEWCSLFRRGNFLLGVSLDGPQDIHDSFRLDGGGRGTFDRVMRSVERLKANSVEFNTLSVVNSKCAGRGKEIYNFFKAIGSRYMQFLPAVEFVSDEHLGGILGDRGRILSPANSSAGGVSEWSTGALDFGNFMCDIFDEWIKADVGEYFVQLFDTTLANWYGVMPGLCAYAKSCGDGLVVEYNGDVYSCDHFVYPEFKLGNLMNKKMREMYGSQQQFEFGVSKRAGLPDECMLCEYYFACTGGCPKHRFRDSAEDKAKNYLCEGYKRYFAHVAPYMAYMRDLLKRGESPAGVMRKIIVK